VLTNWAGKMKQFKKGRSSSNAAVERRKRCGC